MKLLTFKRAYIEPILDGTKITTIRRPRPGLPNPGEVVQFLCQYSAPPFAFVRVTSVEHVRIESLTDRQARADGFPRAAALRAALAETYPDAEHVVILHFELVQLEPDLTLL